jgi:hypothetical protein
MVDFADSQIDRYPERGVGQPKVAKANVKHMTDICELGASKLCSGRACLRERP